MNPQDKERIVSKLKALNKPEMALEIEKMWDKTAESYSQYINSYTPQIKMEPVLKNAFSSELKRVGYEDSETKQILEDMDNNRIIQTAPHLIPSNGPRMFFIDWLSSLNLNRSHYVVAMYSGIPFSNSFHPGCLSFKVNEKDEKRIWVVPSKMQDDLVFKSALTEKTNTVISALPNNLKDYFSSHLREKESQRKINSKVLGKDNLVYIDLNEVVSNYLIEICKQPEHVLYKILFDIETRGHFQKFFGNEKLFVTPYTNKKYPDNESLGLSSDALIGKHHEIKIAPQSLTEALELKRLCPSTFTCFLVLAFINGFKCLGSFRQSVYLPAYKTRLINSQLLDNTKIESVPCCNLTTGIFTQKEMLNVRPLDILSGETLSPDKDILMGEVIMAVEELLYT